MNSTSQVQNNFLILFSTIQINFIFLRKNQKTFDGNFFEQANEVCIAKQMQRSYCLKNCIKRFHLIIRFSLTFQRCSACLLLTDFFRLEEFLIYLRLSVGHGEDFCLVWGNHLFASTTVFSVFFETIWSFSWLLNGIGEFLRLERSFHFEKNFENVTISLFCQSLFPWSWALVDSSKLLSIKIVQELGYSSGWTFNCIIGCTSSVSYLWVPKIILILEAGVTCPLINFIHMVSVVHKPISV